MDATNGPQLSQQDSEFCCLGCALFCDDGHVTSGNSPELRFTGEQRCQLGDTWFNDASERTAAPPSGIRASVIEELSAALATSNAPCFLIGDHVDVDTCRTAVRCAATVNAPVYYSVSPQSRHWNSLAQTHGLHTCTLGEVHHRADLLVFAGKADLNRHPRLLSQLGIDAPSLKTDLEHPLVALARNTRPNSDPGISPSWQVVFTGDCEIETIQSLRMVLDSDSGRLQSTNRLQRAKSIDLNDAVESLGQSFRQSRYAVVIRGIGEDDPGMPFLQQLLRLSQELRPETRVHFLSLTEATVADSLAWLGVDDACGRSPDGQSRLPQEHDLIVCVGDHRGTHIPGLLNQGLNKTVSDPAIASVGQVAKSHLDQIDYTLPTPLDGTACRSTFIRFDGIPIVTTPLTCASDKTTAAILNEINTRLLKYAV